MAYPYLKSEKTQHALRYLLVPEKLSYPEKEVLLSSFP